MIYDTVTRLALKSRGRKRSTDIDGALLCARRGLLFILFEKILSEVCSVKVEAVTREVNLVQFGSIKHWITFDLSVCIRPICLNGCNNICMWNGVRD